MSFKAELDMHRRKRATVVTRRGNQDHLGAARDPGSRKVMSVTKATGSAASFSVISTILSEFDWAKVGAVSIATPMGIIVTHRGPAMRIEHLYPSPGRV